MSGNDYDGVFEEQEVALLRLWATRAGFQGDAIPDVLQEVALVVIGRFDDWKQATAGKRKQLLWIIARNTLGKLKRSDERRRRRDEQKALMTEEAYFDDTPSIRHDVQEVVAGLDERCRTVCKLLSGGVSKAQIAEQMQCSWGAVDRLVRTIRERLEEAEVNAWLQ